LGFQDYLSLTLTERKELYEIHKKQLEAEEEAMNKGGK